MGDKNCLWAVGAEGRTHYIMGSVHLLKEEHFPLNRALEDAFTSAEVVVVEADESGTSQEQMGEMLRARGVYEDGQTLEGMVSRETYDLVMSRALDTSNSFEDLNRIKPWLLTLMFTGIEGAKRGLEGTKGVDKYFLAKAKAIGKAVIALETVEEQMDFLAGVPPKLQELDLVNTLTSAQRGESKLDEIVDAWHSGDINTLEVLLLEYGQKYPEASEALITRRNQNWRPRIKSYIHSPRIHLVIVGAAHLAGTHGIIQWLQQSGYAIEQL
jgi:uncharacterized protein